jgi:hypothetical protein
MLHRMKYGSLRRFKRHLLDPDTVSVHEGEGSNSELLLSTASNTTLKDLKMTDAERKKERKDRRAIKTANRGKRKEEIRAKA